jgi:hypothetical protein
MSGATSSPEVFALQVDVPRNLYNQLDTRIITVRFRALSARHQVEFIVTVSIGVQILGAYSHLVPTRFTIPME